MKRKELRRSRYRVRNYIEYKLLSLLPTSLMLWHFLSILVALSIVLYCVKEFTSLGPYLSDFIEPLLNLVIYTLLIVFVLCVYVYSFLKLRKNSFGIKKNLDPCQYPAVCFPFGSKCRLEIRHLEEVKPLNPILVSMLSFLPFDKRELFVIDAGALDVPKISLEEVRVDEKSGSISLSVTSVSFFDVYYTHYFADGVLTAADFREESKSPMTLREMLGTDIEQFVKAQCERFHTSGVLKLFHLMPNPLGVTGIVRVKHNQQWMYLLRSRGRNVINQIGSVDWSFSGLVESHEFLDRYYAGEKWLDLSQFVINELWDETFGGRISRDELFELIDDVSAIGLVFNATYLFQPELIVLVNLSDYEQASKYIDCSERKWLTEQEIESIIKLSEDALHSMQTPKVKFKDIFTPAWRLFQEYVASGNHCRS